MPTEAAAAHSHRIDSQLATGRCGTPAPQGLKRGNHVRVPGPPRSGFSEPTRFRLLHHANVVVTDGDSYRMREARARGGTTLTKK